MPAASKRKTSSRAKGGRGLRLHLAPPVLTSPRRPWVREVFNISLVALALFVFLSLISHYASIWFPGSLLTHDRTGVTSNVMGPVGHVVATVFVGAIGMCAFVPVIWVLATALLRGLKFPIGPHPYRRGVALAGGIVGLTALTALTYQVSGAFGGGTLGQSLCRGLIAWIGRGGAALVTIFAVAIGTCVVLHYSVSDVASGARALCVFVSRSLCIRIPRGLYRTTRTGVSLSARSIAQLFGWLFQHSMSREPREIAPSKVMAVTKSRQKKVPGPVLELTHAVEGSARERSHPVIVKTKPLEVTQEGNARSSSRTQSVEPGSASPFAGYEPPSVSLLVREDSSGESENDEELREKAEQIERKLADFNIAGRVTQVHPGPVITLFEFEPAAGVKVGRIAALQDDLAMSLKASSIRIIAPIPKRGTVGIEVPNRHRHIVRLRDCLESEAFRKSDSILCVPLGKDTYGDAVVVDVATMPHLLIAGATGTGKSVCINAFLLSLLYRADPSELGLILLDPKVLELSIYDGIPHLRVPVVTDPRQAKAVLSWAVKEMDRRYRYMQKFGVRNIDGYNRIVSGEDAPMERSSPLPVPGDAGLGPADLALGDAIAQEELKAMPKLVIVIDELADLMLTVGREIEDLITRLAQKARAAGIHLIVATQRPSVDVITGLIKANFPARLSFRVSSRIDSRTILDSMGAEKLLGKGDMLFMLPGAVPLRRVHGAFVSDNEVQKMVQALKSQCGPQYDLQIIAAVEKALEDDVGGSGGGENSEGAHELDPFYDKAVDLVLEKGQASTSMIQRAFRIGYNRAARIVEVMEREGIVGPMDGVKPREVLHTNGQVSG